MSRPRIPRFAFRWLPSLAIGAGLLGCGRAPAGWEAPPQRGGHHQEQASNLLVMTPEQIEKGQVRIEEARLVRLRGYLSATGVVSLDESRVAQIRPLARGVIEQVYVRRGDRVRQGDPLILYDNIELGEVIGDFLSRKSQLEKYLAEQEVARKFWERGLQLFQFQAIARKEVELREAQFKNAQAMVDSQRSEITKAEEKLHRFGLSERDIINLAEHAGGTGHRTESHNMLRAPFAGVVIGYDVAQGEIVDPTRPLLTLADVGTVWVLADVYEKDLGRIREGAEVEIGSVSYPDRIFRGRLTYISDVLEKETRTARVRCVVSNADNLLKLEMFVSVRIPTVEEKLTVAVPAVAIQKVDGQDVVFVAEREGSFRQAPVKTGLAVDGWIEVEGLAEGTRVVTRGSFYLKTALKRSEIEPEH